MNIQERTGRSDRTDLKTQDDLKCAVIYTDAFAAKKKKMSTRLRPSKSQGALKKPTGKQESDEYRECKSFAQHGRSYCC